VYININSSSPTLTNCTIKDNGSQGIYVNQNACSPKITDCNIIGNQAEGLYCVYGSATVSGCTISSNGSYGVRCKEALSWVSLTNCVIAKTKNSSYGVALSGFVTTSTITNCTIVGNAYGIYGYGATEEVKNCILWNNVTDLSYCDANYSCIEDQDSGIGNIHVYPMFVNDEANDFRLFYSSACIDAGDPCSDYSNEPEPNGGRINMGAYGNTSKATTIVDEDEDGISDDWEEFYWPGDEPNQHDPNDDPDGDGLRNKDEYYLAWHPNDFNSFDGIIRNDRIDVNYPSINWAMLLASNADTLVLDPNTFYENINFNNKPIHLRSTDPNDPCVVALTIIDANSPSVDVVAFDSGEDANSILDGLTITGGQYGIKCTASSSPLVTNCKITANSSHGIYNMSCSPEITNCVISNNTACGLYCYTGSLLTVSRCTIINNGSYGVHFDWGNATLTNCIIAKNDSYGVYKYGSSNLPTIVNCTIVGNTTYGILGACEKVTNSILWNNGTELLSCDANYCCIEDVHPGLGNFSADPCFKDYDGNDFHLDPNYSTCVDTGEPWADYSQEPSPNGNRINLGRYGNTSEAAITVDDNGDGISDAWQKYYWPDYDPCDPNYGPGGNPDGDCYTNLSEYLFGYEPNTQEAEESMVIAHVVLDASTIDPTQDETLTIEYWVNIDANVTTSFTSTDTSETVRVLEEWVVVGPNDAVWDGRDANGLIVEDGFYDILIDANDGAGHDANSKPGTIEVYYDHDINNLQCNPYRIIPVNDEVSKITYDLTVDANMVVTVYDPCGVLFTTLVDDELQTEGGQELIWYGRDKDPGDPDGVYISKEGQYLVRIRFVGMREKDEATITAYK
jgi:hypothetical protein